MGYSYPVNLQFIASPVYSDQIDGLLSAEDHRQLQMHLLEQPDRGDVIKGSGGLRSCVGLAQAEAREAASASFITYGAGTQRSCFSHIRRTHKRI